jgi:MYXO-CTERM domain-containing protein
VLLGADPNDKDSDDDGLLDGDESNPADDHDGDGKLNVVDADSDGDGLFDGTEVGKACADPDTAASANACIADADQGATRTGLLQADTDKGGAKDGDEDDNHDGKVDAPFERDPNVAADDADVPPVRRWRRHPLRRPHQRRGLRRGDLEVRRRLPRDGGNGCPAGKECSSTDATIGKCEEPETTGGTGATDVVPGDAGCSCELVSSPREGIGGWLLLGGLVLAGARRRRR